MEVDASADAAERTERGGVRGVDMERTRSWGGREDQWKHETYLVCIDSRDGWRWGAGTDALSAAAFARRDRDERLG